MFLKVLQETELYICEEAFLCGSAMEITPVLSVDKYIIGNGETGKITKSLQESYIDVAKGNRTEFKDWLTAIY